MSFLEAQSVLKDPMRRVEEDDLHSVHEARVRVTGYSDAQRLLVVIISIDATSSIRVISARRPTRRERHEYEDHP